MSADKVQRIESALEVLADLSERSTDGRLRDSIATVRSALWDDLDALSTPGGDPRG